MPARMVALSSFTAKPSSRVEAERRLRHKGADLTLCEPRGRNVELWSWRNPRDGVFSSLAADPSAIFSVWHNISDALLANWFSGRTDVDGSTVRIRRL